MTPQPLPSRERFAAEVTQELIDSTSTSRGLLLVGQAGIGKTHLLRSVAGDLHTRGLDPIVLNGSVAGIGIPLAAFSSAIVSPDLTPGEESVSQLIRHLSLARGRSALLVDSVDRLDAASLFVVQHCIRDLRRPVLLTVRDLAQVPEALHEPYDTGDLRIRRVDPLDHAESLSLAARYLGDRLTPRAARILLERSEGVPLYIRELIAGSRQSGALLPTVHGWDFRQPPRATPRLAQLVGAAFDEVDDDAAELAGMLAVTDGMPAALVAEGPLRTLLQRGIADADADGLVRLAHPLYAEALSARTSPAMLNVYRGHALDLLNASAAHAGSLSQPRRIALAVAAGRPVDSEQLLEEAQRAQGLMDHDLAHRLSSLVLDAEPGHPLATRVAGAAASGRGDPDAETLLRRALRLASNESERSGAARSLAHHLAVRRHDPLGAAGVLAAVLDIVYDPAERSRLEHDLLQWQMVGGTLGVIPPPPEASEGAAYTHHLAVSLMVTLIVGPLDIAESTSRLLEQRIAIYRDEVPTGPAIAQLGRFMLTAYRGDILTARGAALSALGHDREQPEMRGAWEYSLGMIELLSGGIDEATRLASAAVDHLRWHDPLGLLPAALALGAATATGQGDPVLTDALSAQIPEATFADPKAAMLQAWTTAWRERTAGRPGSAADILMTAAERLRELRHVFLAGMLAHCAARLGHADRALPVLEPLAEGGGVLELFLAHAQAAHARDTDRLAHLADRFETLGMLPSAVDMMTLLARSARASRDVMTARRWEWRIGEIRAHGAPMALWAHGREEGEPLSAREREVARLAAQRLSAREIGERLGISAKTVENHLASVYRKLGISRRAGLRKILTTETTGHTG